MRPKRYRLLAGVVKPSPPRVMAYVDSIFFYVRAWPPGLPRRGRNHTSGPLRMKIDGRWQRVGYMIRLRQPSRSTILRWSCRQTMSRLGPARHEIILNRVDIAADLQLSNAIEAEAVHQQMDRSIFFKYPGKGGHNGQKTEAVTYGKLPGARHNFAIYGDKPSKPTGAPCAHVELRRRSELCRRTYGRQVDALLEVDPAATFRRFFRDTFAILLPHMPSKLTWFPRAYGHTRAGG